MDKKGSGIGRPNEHFNIGAGSQKPIDKGDDRIDNGRHGVVSVFVENLPEELVFTDGTSYPLKNKGDKDKLKGEKVEELESISNSKSEGKKSSAMENDRERMRVSFLRL
ncbi:hypothetical protein V6N12_013022 [Hibiscus sabdariffa]|uniref:Uncharacterized protein n=1 Tax=Hibiscus sabdariffa TaxID=183260 RepID=A0ABR2EGH4_9ROSI